MNQVDNGSILASSPNSTWRLPSGQGSEDLLSLTVTSLVEDGCAVLDIKGALTLGPALNAVREEAKRVLGNGRVAGLVLLVGDLTLTDSSGLGELTVVYSLAAKKGCPVRLVGTSPSLRRMLEMTRIDELLPTAANLSEAKSSLKTSQ